MGQDLQKDLELLGGKLNILLLTIFVQESEQCPVVA